jgi:chromate transport protein ChrA
MAIDPHQEPKLSQATTSLAVALAMVGVAIAAFFLSTYISGSVEERIPVANLFMGILLCIAGLVLAGMVLHGRGSWREVASFLLPALVAGLAALRFGFAGVLLVVVAGSLVYQLLRRHRRRVLRADET